MTTDIIVSLAIFAFVTSVTPGPNNLMLLASGINFGFTRTIPHMSGISIGFMVMVLLVGAGLIQLFDAYPLSYTILKVLSISYLLFLAWKIATTASYENQRTDDGSEAENPGRPFTFFQAALFQWVNPKAWAFALTAITAYTPPSHPLFSVLIVTLTCGVVNLPSVAIWAVLGTQLRRFLRSPKQLRAFNIVAALLLIGSLYPILF